MAEQAQESFLTSITDNVAQTLFEGSASSQNVITPTSKEDAEQKTEPHKEPERQPNPKFGELKPPIDKFSATDLLGDVLEVKPEPVVETKTAPGEPTKTTEPEKTGEDFNFLVEGGILNPYEDDAPVKTKKDLENLIKANKEYWVTEAKANATKEIAETLPEELKFLFEYAKNGGGDLKTVFKLLGESEEVRAYDVQKPEDQRAIIRKYYATQDWTEDEIEEEILSLAENPDRQKAQAEKLKPKLDKIKAEDLAEKKQEQDQIVLQQSQAKQFFVNNVVDALKKETVGGIKLTKEEQKDVYNALITEQYTSFGGKTNRLGALLDKIQYIEPDYDLLAKITMYLSDPAGFEEKLRKQITTDVTAEQVKKIKIDQSKQKIGSSHNPERETKKLPKLQAGFINPFD